jgi:hypothetical protein
MGTITYQKVFNDTETETRGWVYEVRIDGEYVCHFRLLREVKIAYPSAQPRGDD